MQYDMIVPLVYVNKACFIFCASVHPIDGDKSIMYLVCPFVCACVRLGRGILDQLAVDL